MNNDPFALPVIPGNPKTDTFPFIQPRPFLQLTALLRCGTALQLSTALPLAHTVESNSLLQPAIPDDCKAVRFCATGRLWVSFGGNATECALQNVANDTYDHAFDLFNYITANASIPIECGDSTLWNVEGLTNLSIVTDEAYLSVVILFFR